MIKFHQFALFGPCSPVLPLDTAFFRRIDLGQVRGLTKEEPLDIVEEESLRVGIRQIQTVMVDDLGLFL